MKITFAHLCDYGLVSADGKLSVLGIFSNIHLSSLPGVHPQMYLAFEIEMNSAEFTQEFRVRVQCMDADGAVIFDARGGGKGEGRIRLGENPRISQLLAFRGTKFVREGDYQINLWLNDRLEFTQGFQVSVIPPAAPPTPPALPSGA